MLFLAIYILVGMIMALPAMLVVAVGGLFKRDWWDTASARFGKPDYQGEEKPIVVWCASLGEVNTAQRLIKGLLTHGKAPLVIAAYTPSGLRRARELFGSQATVTLAPLDILSFSRRWIEHIKPRMIILFETELWPLTLRIAADNGVKLALVNARLSDRSYPRYRKLKFVWKPVLRRLHLVAAQSELFAVRLIEMGAKQEDTATLGSLKFDVTLPQEPTETVKAFYRAFCADHRLLIAGSTHPGEEKMIAQVVADLQRQFTDLRLICAPRHIKRAPQALVDLTAAGLRAVCRSSAKADELSSADALLLDTMGELNWVYGLASVALVGGSFGDVGGHNVLEPAVLGVPVLCGPRTPNFTQEVEALRQTGGLVVVENEQALRKETARLLENAERQSAMGQAAETAVRKHQGATDRTLTALLKMIE